MVGGGHVFEDMVDLGGHIAHHPAQCRPCRFRTFGCMARSLLHRGLQILFGVWIETLDQRCDGGVFLSQESLQPLADIGDGVFQTLGITGVCVASGQVLSPPVDVIHGFPEIAALLSHLLLDGVIDSTVQCGKDGVFDDVFMTGSGANQLTSQIGPLGMILAHPQTLQDALNPGPIFFELMGRIGNGYARIGLLFLLIRHGDTSSGAPAGLEYLCLVGFVQKIYEITTAEPCLAEPPRRRGVEACALWGPGDNVAGALLWVEDPLLVMSTHSVAVSLSFTGL
jgi:hypothetical protein